jgi:Tfp pilus assembly protein PilX
VNTANKQREIGSKNGEKGIALLFTLGMLTVLLVLALGFATTSITQRRSAATNTQGTVARLLAESTLERVMGSLQFYDDARLPCSYSDDVTHPLAPPENRGQHDWLYKLQTAETVQSPLVWKNEYSDISWEYITVNDGVNNRIIGRVAYVITYTSE